MSDETFRSTYMEYREALFRFGYRMTGSQVVAQDLVQECFLGLFRGGYDKKRGGIKTYLYGAVRNLARKYYREAGRAYEQADAEVETPFGYFGDPGVGEAEMAAGESATVDIMENVSTGRKVADQFRIGDRYGFF